jgi:hypothetical protein
VTIERVDEVSGPPETSSDCRDTQDRLPFVQVPVNQGLVCWHVEIVQRGLYSYC